MATDTEEIWKAASEGYTLHQLRHSRLTHLAEAGEDVTMIKANPVAGPCGPWSATSTLGRQRSGT